MALRARGSCTAKFAQNNYPVKNERLPASGQWDRFGVDYAGYFIILCKNGPEALTLAFWPLTFVNANSKMERKNVPDAQVFFLRAFKSLL